jgi:hypothetical protein
MIMSRNNKNRILFLLSFTVLINPPSGWAGSFWEEKTYEDFSDGTFDDAGANTYVSRNGRIQTINRWDVNNDGYIDILSVNSHPLVEMLDMSIYWGNGHDFSIQNHSYVPADGPMWVAPGDLDKDGEMDLVVANFSNGTWTSMDSAVYWGGLESPDSKPEPGTWGVYPFHGKTDLPAQNTQGVAVHDLNRNGYLDIVFAFSKGFWEYSGDAYELESPSRIYWNSADGLDPEKYSEIGTHGATDVDIADVNGDTWPDILFSNGEGDLSYLYLGSPDGFSPDHRIEVPTVSPHACRIADVDNDDKLDLLFANEKGRVSYAYLNRDNRFSEDDRFEFETTWAKDVVVADFNRDGFNDVFFTNHQFSFTGNWRFANRNINSWIYWGSGDGFSSENRQDIQTIGAWGANAADLNNDGWVDLLVCNYQEQYSYEVPSFIYWNGPEGFEVTRRTPLYEHGASGNTIADFNGDGHLDVLITSMIATSRGDYDPSYVYLGSPDGQYTVEKSIKLIGREPYEQGMADLDDDGQVDILLQNAGERSRWENELYIFWNRDNEFSNWRVTGLPSYGAVGVEPCDLDRDGYLDIIISSGRYYPDVAARNKKRGKDAEGYPEADPGSFIYWGSEYGWPVTERTVLKVNKSRAPSIADLNRDGHLDLVFAGPGSSIYFGDGTRDWSEQRRQDIVGCEKSNQCEVADLDQDGYLDIVFAGEVVRIYPGDASSSYAEMIEVETSAKTINIADVDGDGWLDLVCPFYKYRSRRSIHSNILLGGAEGFDPSRSIQLFTDGATGSMVSDFNFDGYHDVFFFCHRQDGSPEEVGKFGSHSTVSRLYFNGPMGFREDEYVTIPSIGAHYDVGVDLGHIVDRTFEYEYESSAHPYEGRPAHLVWDAETPAHSSVRFQLRTAMSKSGLKKVEWQGPLGEASWYRDSNLDDLDLAAGRWIQYKAALDTGNGAISPILKRVRIVFD